MGKEENNLSLWQKVFFAGTALYGISEISKTSSDFDKRVVSGIAAGALTAYKGPEIIKYTKDVVNKSSEKIDPNNLGVALLCASGGYILANNYTNKKAKQELKE